MEGVGDFTIATWVYWNAARTGERVFDFGARTDRYMYLTARAGSGAMRFGMRVNGNFGEVLVNCGAALPTGKWVHVAVTLSGRQATVYVNGVATGSSANMFHAPFRIWDTSQNWIGRSQYGTVPYFNGKIDGFQVYRGAMTAAQVTALMNGQPIHADVSAATQLTQQGAVLNRATLKHVGSVDITNNGPALQGPFILKLLNLTAGVTLDNPSGTDGGAPYVAITSPVPAGATVNVPLTFSNRERTVISYTPQLLQRV